MIHYWKVWYQFTFHYVSIKSSPTFSPDGERHNLHSTMYLLNRWTNGRRWNIWRWFTFHYVSIKSQVILLCLWLTQAHLHSTMYLLNLEARQIWYSNNDIFTFHYVSIKSQSGRLSDMAGLNLHSTMYLLNHQ